MDRLKRRPPVSRCLWMAALLLLVPFQGVPAARAQTAAPNGIVALMTDFGSDDYSAGALQGAVLSADLHANLVTISNDVPAFDVREGAYWLQQAAAHYPAGTVYLAIVDPNIGTATDPKIVVQTDDGSIFVGPDNGLLSLALGDRTVLHAYALTSPALMAPGSASKPVSEGLEVDDIYAYAAGVLATGTAPAQAGPEVTDWTKLTIPAATPSGNSLTGEVVDVDHFGNLTTNIPADLVTQAGLTLGEPVTITMGTQTISATFAQSYGDVPTGAYLVYVDEGQLSVAINLGDASKATGADAGQTIAVTPSR